MEQNLQSSYSLDDKWNECDDALLVTDNLLFTTDVCTACEIDFQMKPTDKVPVEDSTHNGKLFQSSEMVEKTEITDQKDKTVLSVLFTLSEDIGTSSTCVSPMLTSLLQNKDPVSELKILQKHIKIKPKLKAKGPPKQSS